MGITNFKINVIHSSMHSTGCFKKHIFMKLKKKTVLFGAKVHYKNKPPELQKFNVVDAFIPNM